MASPTYGTGIANYMNMFAGQARGMNEAARLQRMQEQQDYSRSFQLMRMQDRIGAREQRREDQYGWNAYNARAQQQGIDQDYDWDVYERGIADDQLGYERGRDADKRDYERGIIADQTKYNRDRNAQQDRLDLARIMQQGGYDSGSIYQDILGLDAPPGKPPSKKQPVSQSEARKIAEARQGVTDPNLSQAERDIYADQLKQTQGYAPFGELPPERQEMGIAGRSWELIKAPYSWLGGGDSPSKNISEAWEGQTQEQRIAEMRDHVMMIKRMEEYRKSGRKLTTKNERDYKNSKKRIDELCQEIESFQAPSVEGQAYDTLFKKPLHRPMMPEAYELLKQYF